MRSHLIIWLGLCAASINATAATVPIQREFRDWVLTCDNLRSCIAEGADAGNPTLVVRISRAGGPQGTASLRLDGTDIGIALSALRVDDRALTINPLQWTADEDEGVRAWISTNPDTIREFIAEVGNGKRLRLGQSGSSLDGFAAAILAMDEAQGRIDTVTAWRKPGPKPADAVPAPTRPPMQKAMPFLGPGPTPAQTRALIAAATALANDERSDCDVTYRDEPEKQVARITATDALVLLECGRGAYQSGFRAYRGPIEAPVQLRQISLRSTPGRPEMSWLMDADYDAVTGTLSHFAKGRGLADCGESASWLFNGSEFVLESLAIETRCQGVRLDFPALWRNE